MKLLNFLSHPYTLIISFLLILVSGEHFGGLYISYILLALPHGGIHAILALAGVIILLVSNRFVDKKRIGLLAAMNVFGLALMLGSITLFFFNDKQHYNWGTFEQAIPLMTLIWAGASAICFLFKSIGGSHYENASVVF